MLFVYCQLSSKLTKLNVELCLLLFASVFKWSQSTYPALCFSHFIVFHGCKNTKHTTIDSGTRQDCTNKSNNEVKNFGHQNHQSLIVSDDFKICLFPVNVFLFQLVSPLNSQIFFTNAKWNAKTRIEQTKQNEHIFNTSPMYF